MKSFGRFGWDKFVPVLAVLTLVIGSFWNEKFLTTSNMTFLIQSIGEIMLTVNDLAEQSTNTNIPVPSKQPLRNANDPANATSDATGQKCLGQ